MKRRIIVVSFLIAIIPSLLFAEKNLHGTYDQFYNLLKVEKDEVKRRIYIQSFLGLFLQKLRVANKNNNKLEEEEYLKAKEVEALMLVDPVLTLKNKESLKVSRLIRINKEVKKSFGTGPEVFGFFIFFIFVYILVNLPSYIRQIK